MKLSICIPVYNGSETIVPLVRALDATFKDMDIEVVLVNDGSRDSSAAVCKNLVAQYPYVVFVDLRRNFGEHNAVMCALNHCSGDYAVIIDDDLQNPPEEILKLLKEIQEGGYDVVYANYHTKKHHWFRNFGSKVNDKFATWLIGKPKDLYLCSFKMINRAMIDEIIRYKGPFPYVDGLLLRATSSISSVFVEHHSRAVGASNYTLGKLFNLWLSMFINFSIKPMRFIMGTGLVISVLAFFLAVFFVIEKILHPEMVPGWTTLIVLVLFFGGLQSVFLGLIGEYIGKNYLDINKTPQWVVKDVHKSKS